MELITAEGSTSGISQIYFTFIIRTEIEITVYRGYKEDEDAYLSAESAFFDDTLQKNYITPDQPEVIKSYKVYILVTGYSSDCRLYAFNPKACYSQILPLDVTKGPRETGSE